MRVSIVEDNPVFSGVMQDVILQEPGFRWQSSYGSAEEACRKLPEEQPDVLIVDISLPGMSGIEMIKILKRQLSSTLFLVCSTHDEDDMIFAALESGADGYILKDSSIDDILNALNDLVKGGAPMSPYIARKVIGSFRQAGGGADNGLEKLTEREKEILQFTATGKLYKEIAALLDLSTLTVKKHMRNIYAKLEVQNKIEALKKSNLI